MKPGGYFWIGGALAAVGVLVLLIAHSNDGVQQAMADYARSVGEKPEPSHDTAANLVAVGLFVVAGVLVLIGAIGTGVRSGVSSRQRTAERP